MNSFQEQFIKKLDEIEDRAHKAGVTITHVCRKSKVARATPDRWRAKAPRSIELMDRLERAVESFEEESGVAPPQESTATDDETDS